LRRDGLVVASYCWSDEIGQPFFASWAAFAKAAWSIPGTQPFTSSALDFTANPALRSAPGDDAT